MIKSILMLAGIACASVASAQTVVEHDIINATVSSHDGNVPTNAIDGLLTTRWSASGRGQTLTLDLGSVKQVTSVSIAFYKGDIRKTSFELSISSDGGTYTKVGLMRMSSGATLSQESFGLSASGRYVRVTGYGNDAVASSLWTSLTEVNVFGSVGPAPTPTPAPAPTLAIATADIISEIQAGVPFAQQRGWNAQVMGQYPAINTIPETGIHGSKLSNGETLRLGKVTDPVNANRKALLFQVHPNDTVTSGSKRSEFQQNGLLIEPGKVYWIAYSVFVYDWGTLPAGDGALFGTQMHTAMAGPSPSFSFFTANSGRSFQVETRYSASTSPTKSNTVHRYHGVHPIAFGRWMDFVLKFRQSVNTANDPFLQVWVDGKQILDFKGPLGYNIGKNDYAKIGYYNWSTFNSSRKILMRSPIVVRDPTGSKYKPEDLRGYVNSK